VRLETGIVVPSFRVVDLAGEEVSPRTYEGKRWWLILSRFAACPFCSLRLHRLLEREKSLADAGVEVVVVFPSSERRARQFVKKYDPWFRIVADPDQVVFELFGSETSWAGEVRTAINVPKVLRALVQTKMNPLGVDDAVHRMPSEYLIEMDGTIGQVHYGEELDDGFAVETVLEWAR
jgi:peroxiredoxin